MRRDQPGALARWPVRPAAALLVAQLDAGPGRQPLDRLSEREVLVVHDELMTSPPAPQPKQ